WQFFPDRLRQQNLCDQQPASPHQAQRKQITILLIFLYAHRGFFQLVYVVVDLLERFRVSRSEKFSVRNFRNLSQTGLIKLHRLVFVDNIAQRVGKGSSVSEDRRWRNSVNAGANGIEVNL